TPECVAGVAPESRDAGPSDRAVIGGRGPCSFLDGTRRTVGPDRNSATSTVASEQGPPHGPYTRQRRTPRSAPWWLRPGRRRNRRPVRAERITGEPVGLGRTGHAHL